jgi:hypothetical protein
MIVRRGCDRWCENRRNRLLLPRGIVSSCLVDEGRMNSRLLRYPGRYRAHHEPPSHQINSASILAARSVALTSWTGSKEGYCGHYQQPQAPAAAILKTAASKTLLRAMTVLAATKMIMQISIDLLTSKKCSHQCFILCYFVLGGKRNPRNSAKSWYCMGKILSYGGQHFVASTCTGTSNRFKRV